MVRVLPVRSCLSFLLACCVSFQIGVATAQQITVSWTDNSPNEDGFTIERKTGLLGTYAPLTTTDANVTAVLDTSVNTGLTYCYRVYAFNAVGNSAYSNEACGLPDILAPTVSIIVPTDGATVAGTVTVTASVSDALGVAEVQFALDGVDLGSEVTTAPYSISWDTTATSEGVHTLTALARNTVGKQTLSAGVTVTVSNRPPPIFGLALTYSFSEGQGMTTADLSGNNHTGTVQGATWTTAGKFTNALSFDGGAAKVVSGLTTQATVESYLMWTKRIGPGGGRRGRIFDKRTSNSEVELLYNDDAVGVYCYLRVWSGGIGRWTIPQPSLNEWHHLAVVYDASSAANQPQIYVDGVAQKVTQVSAPKGTPLTNTDPYVIGNRGSGDRGWSGVLDEVWIYHMALTVAQIQTAMATPVAATNLPIVAYGFNEGAGTRVANAASDNWNGTVADAIWTAVGKYGNALAFDGGAAQVRSELNIQGTMRSYLLWTNRTGPGGNNLGRIFDKRTDGREVEVFFNDETAGVYRYLRVWSGGIGRWTIPQPSLNEWHHLAVVYDASSAANKPQIYVDGVAQKVTQECAPMGTLLTNTDPYVIGNRGSGDRGWSGVLDEVQIYDVVLTPAQIQAAMTTAIAGP